MLDLDYDSLFDTLYLRVGDNSNSYSAEVVDNVNIFRDLQTRNVTGFLVFGFMEKYRNSSLPDLPFLTQIDYEKDVIPLITV